MFVELISALRCLTPHEESWLVAAARRTVGRNVAEGTLGCPVCRREYPIVGGVAYFGTEPPAAAGTRAEERWDAPADAPDEALRLAALLDLATPGGLVVLGGGWGRLAPALLEIAPVRCLLVDPDFDARGAGELSVIRSAGAIPIAAGAARGVALDALAAGEGTLAAAVRALGAGGRLVAPAEASLPAGIAELARDGALWVGERAEAPPSAPVAIGRPRRA
ncbi:MAG: hypothetical protein ACJ79S_16415 [Gemmatimonadaceae bacterium]